MTQRNSIKLAAVTAANASRKGGVSRWGRMILQNVFAMQLAVLLSSVLGYGVSMM